MEYIKINMTLLYLLSLGMVKIQSSQENIANVSSRKRSRADIEKRVVFSELGNSKIIPSIGSSPQDLTKFERAFVRLNFASNTDTWKSLSNLGNCKKLSPKDKIFIDLLSQKFLKFNKALDDQTRSIYAQNDTSKELLCDELAILLEVKEDLRKKLSKKIEKNQEQLGKNHRPLTVSLKNIESYRMSELKQDINFTETALNKFNGKKN